MGIGPTCLTTLLCQLYHLPSANLASPAQVGCSFLYLFSLAHTTLPTAYLPTYTKNPLGSIICPDLQLPSHHSTFHYNVFLYYPTISVWLINSFCCRNPISPSHHPLTFIPSNIIQLPLPSTLSHCRRVSPEGYTLVACTGGTATSHSSSIM